MDKEEIAIPSIEKLDLNSNEETQSIQGATWITLQSVEHIFNSVSKRDGFTNRYLPLYLSHYLEEIEGLRQSIESPRHFPKDEIFSLITFTDRALRKILNNPRSNLIKNETLLHVNKAKSLDSKSMIWLGKQPGRTMIEKIGIKNKVLTKVSEYTYETKENQVVARYLKIIAPVIEKRIECFGTSGLDGDKYDLKKNFLDEIYRTFRNSELYNVSGNFDFQPNNVLINDRNYSVIWRGYKELSSYSGKVKRNWNSPIERFTTALFYGLLGKLSSIKGFQVANRLLVVKDDEDLSLAAGLSEVLTSFKEVKVFYQPAATSDETKSGEIIFIKRDENNFGVLSVVEGENSLQRVIFGRKHFHNLEDFDRIKKGDNVNFTYEIDQLNRIKIKKIENSFVGKSNVENSFETLIFKLSDKKILIEKEGNLNLLTFEFTEGVENLEKNRGLPINVSTFKGNDKINYSFSTFGDCLGYKETIEKMYKKIRKNIRNEEVLKNIKFQEKINAQRIGIDFTTYIPSINSLKYSEYNLENSLTVVKNSFLQNEYLEMYKDNYPYIKTTKIFPMNDIFNKNSSVEFDKSSENLHGKTNLDKKSFLSFTVPDSIDEFAQEPIKTILKHRFENSFPVWRSIGSGIWFQSEKEIKLNNKEEILVIDCSGSHVSATKLVVIGEKDKNLIYEHYPSFPDRLEKNFFTNINLQKVYLDKISNNSLNENEKEWILKSGLVENSLDKKEKIDYFNEDKHVTLEYSDECYEDLKKDGKKEIEKYIRNVVKEHNLKLKNILLLSEYIDDFNLDNYKVHQVDSKKISFGASVISRRLEKKEETWREYLPNLSLEIIDIDNGHFGEIKLISEKSITPLFGAVEIIKVEKELKLPKKKKFYKFPLIKQETSGVAKEYEAYISSDEHFPLEIDVRVKLEIAYKYGVENSYDLKLIPLEGQEGIKFTELHVKWEEHENLAHISKLEIPKKKIPSSNDVKEVLDSIIRINKNLNNIKEKENLVYDIRSIGRIRNRIKSICTSGSREIELQLVQDKDFIRYNDLCEKLFFQLIDNWEGFKHLIFEKNPKNILLRNFAVQGKYAPLWFKVKCLEENITFKNNKLVGLLGALITGNPDHELIGKFISYSDNGGGTDFLHAISDICKSDYNFLKVLFSSYEGIEGKLINILEENLKYISIKLPNFKQVKENAWKLLEPFRRDCELLVFLLGLEDEIPGLKDALTSEKKNKLLKHIKKIDYLVYAKDLRSEFKPKLKFNIKKDSSLCNVSDLAYVLIQELGGQSGVNLIQISEIIDEE